MLEESHSPQEFADTPERANLERELCLTPFIDTLRAEAGAAAERWVNRCGLSLAKYEFECTTAHEFNVLRLHLPTPRGGELLVYVGARDVTPKEAWRELAKSKDLRLFVADDDTTRAALATPKLYAGLKRLSLLVRNSDSGASEPDAGAISTPLNTFANVHDRTFRWVGEYDGVTQGMLRLGFRCNQDCAFCWQGRTWAEPPADYYEVWLRQMVAAGLERIAISGGEPTLHRDLTRLVGIASSGGAVVSLQTNAILLGRGDLAVKLRAAGLAEASVSLHAGEAELSDRMTRAPGTFVRTKAGIEAALAAGLGVNLTCVVERDNVHALARHAEFIVESFGEHANNLSVAYAHPAEYYDQDHWADALVPLDVSGPAVGQAVTALRRAGIIVNTQGGCGFPTCALRDFPEALQSLAPERLPAGEVASRMYAEECADCALRPGCVGLRRVYFDKFGGRGVRPFEALTPMIEGLVREQPL